MSGLRIGLVSPYNLSVPGGVQAQVLGLAAYLRTWGDDPVVMGPGLPDGVPGVDLGESISVPGNGSMAPIAADPRSRRRIRAASADLDLLHVHEPLMPLVSLLATHAGPPVVATFHAAPGRAVRLGYRLTRPFLSRLLGNTSMVTAVSHAAAGVLPEGRLEVRVIPNGLDVASMRVQTRREVGKVAFLGRDEPRKGLDVLLEAWERIETARPQARLVVMGARRDGTGPTWMGRVDEGTKATQLSSSSVYVAPQTGGESFGIVLLEAMAAGAAVVASDLEPFRDLAGEAARFFPVGDSGALATAVIDLLGDPIERDRLAELGRRLADEHDWSVIGGVYRELYDEVVT
ncbi:MAG: glycosyltransferase family 1 protein [Acidimicrobiia bacterium]|nr:glycosyltransferase family 1 protein [Acidimicrobiia bacterium]